MIKRPLIALSFGVALLAVAACQTASKQKPDSSPAGVTTPKDCDDIQRDKSGRPIPQC